MGDRGGYNIGVRQNKARARVCRQAATIQNAAQLPDSKLTDTWSVSGQQFTAAGGSSDTDWSKCTS